MHRDGTSGLTPKEQIAAQARLDAGAWRPGEYIQNGLTAEP
jgi:hypothetical protein